MAELNQNDKDRILQEETYRLEVRKQLMPSSSGNKFLKFFNTNLGLFFLSTVLIGGVTFCYEKREENKEKRIDAFKLEDERRFLLDKLQNEVALRLTVLSTANDTLLRYQSKNVYLVLNGNLNSKQINADHYNFQSMYSEYASWSLLKLIGELQKVEMDTVNNSILRDISKNLFDNLPLLNKHSSSFFWETSRGNTLPYQAKPRQIKKPNSRLNGLWYYRLNGKSYYLHNEEVPTKMLFKLKPNEDLENLIKKVNKYLNRLESL